MIDDNEKKEFWNDIYNGEQETSHDYDIEENRLVMTKKKVGETVIEFRLQASPAYEVILTDQIESGKVSANTTIIEKLLATYDIPSKTLELFPTLTWYGHEYSLPDKYEQIKSVLIENLSYRFIVSSATLDGMMKKAPRCFQIEYYKGMGFKKEYKSIIENIEDQTQASKIVISDNHKNQKSDEFVISHATIEEMTREIDRINNRANLARNEVRDTTVYNVIAEILGTTKRAVRFGRHPIRQAITHAAMNEYGFDDETNSQLINAVQSNIDHLLKKIPEKIERLKGDLELATLDGLIAKFEQKMEKHSSEQEWQTFFKNNPIILSLASSYPLILVDDEASVGGRKLDGKGDKIADFIYGNQITDNALIVEIKTTKQKIITQEYRGGVYSVHSNLTGAINQVRDQRQKLIRELAQLKQNAQENDEQLTLQTFAVDCLLVVGETPTKMAEKRSWELFRGGLSDVSVVTFDELLSKLKNIRSVF